MSLINPLSLSFPTCHRDCSSTHNRFAGQRRWRGLGMGWCQGPGWRLLCVPRATTASWRCSRRAPCVQRPLRHSREGGAEGERLAAPAQHEALPGEPLTPKMPPRSCPGLLLRLAVRPTAACSDRGRACPLPGALGTPAPRESWKRGCAGGGREARRREGLGQRPLGARPEQTSSSPQPLSGERTVRGGSDPTPSQLLPTAQRPRSPLPLRASVSQL